MGRVKKIAIAMAVAEGDTNKSGLMSHWINRAEVAIEAMQEDREISYLEGSRSAWLLIFQEALKQLGRDSPEWSEKRWLMEREAAISALRRVCEEHGDNDWNDELHLADIIEKHLGRYLLAVVGETNDV